jgi:two-component system, NtrC family, response regulator
MKVLTTSEWPGNVRELINVLEFALASAGSDPILHPKHLPPEYRASFFDPPPQLPTTDFDTDEAGSHAGGFPCLGDFRETHERQYFQVLIRKARGDRETACRLAGISQARLYDLLKKYRLSLFKPA